MRKITVAHPWVDLPASTARLRVYTEEHEVNLVCQDTGLVVYTTPCYTWAGERRSVPAAQLRASRWLHRHGFRLNLSDRGYFTREVTC